MEKVQHKKILTNASFQESLTHITKHEQNINQHLIQQPLGLALGSGLDIQKSDLLILM